MCKSLRYAIPLAIATVWLTAALPTHALAQGTAAAASNQGVAKARQLIRQANGLAYDLDEAPCSWIRVHQVTANAERTLDQLWNLMQLALDAGETGLADDINAAGQNLYEALDYYYDDDCGGPGFIDVITFRKFIEVNVAGGGVEVAMPKRSYLGLESGGVPRVGLVSPDGDLSGGSFNASVKFNMSGVLSAPLKFGTYGASDTWGKIGFYYMKATGSQAIGTIDSGAGVQVLAPGPDGGASGFAFPAGFPAQGTTYSSDLSKTGGRLDLGQTLHYSTGVKFDLYGSVGYAHTSFDERFSANIVGLNLDYNSSADVDQFKLRFGVGLSKDFLLSSGLTFNLGGYAEAGPDFSRATGDDRLSLTGFADSSVSPSASDTGFGYRLGVTAGVKTKFGLGLSIEGAYFRESGLPVFERDGNSPTTLQLEPGDVWTIMGRGTLRF